MLAEDSTLLREGLALLLAEEGHEVLASVGDGTSLVRAVEADPPDLVVVDIRMPPTHTDEGLRAALEIRERWPLVGVLVLSQHVERNYAVRLLSQNAERVGYLLKDRVAQVDEFLESLERIHAGGASIDAEVVRQLVVRTTHVDPLARLTPRERSVLQELAQGRSNAAIAQQLHISLSSVEKNLNAVFEKLDLPRTTGYSRMGAGSPALSGVLGPPAGSATAQFRRAAPYRLRKRASTWAMCWISVGSTLSLGAWMRHCGSSTPIRMISARGYALVKTLHSGMEPPWPRAAIGFP